MTPSTKTCPLGSAAKNLTLKLSVRYLGGKLVEEWVGDVEEGTR